MAMGVRTGVRAGIIFTTEAVEIGGGEGDNVTRGRGEKNGQTEISILLHVLMEYLVI